MDQLKGYWRIKMIINEENKDSMMFKGSVLRGFNNTPSNIRDNIIKADLKLKQYKQNSQNDVVDKKKDEEYDPKKERELISKMNRINK